MESAQSFSGMREVLERTEELWLSAVQQQEAAEKEARRSNARLRDLERTHLCRGEALEKRVVKLTEKLECKRKDIEKMTEAVTDLVAKYESALAVKQRRISDLERAVEDSRAHASRLKAEMSELRTENGVLRAASAELKSQLASVAKAKDTTTTPESTCVAKAKDTTTTEPSSKRSNNHEEKEPLVQDVEEKKAREEDEDEPEAAPPAKEDHESESPTSPKESVGTPQSTHEVARVDTPAVASATDVADATMNADPEAPMWSPSSSSALGSERAASPEAAESRLTQPGVADEKEDSLKSPLKKEVEVSADRPKSRSLSTASLRTQSAEKSSSKTTDAVQAHDAPARSRSRSPLPRPARVHRAVERAAAEREREEKRSGGDKSPSKSPTRHQQLVDNKCSELRAKLQRAKLQKHWAKQAQADEKLNDEQRSYGRGGREDESERRPYRSRSPLARSGSNRRDAVCFYFVANQCKKGDDCPLIHPLPEDIAVLKETMRMKTCKFGSACWRSGCLYHHDR